MPLINPPMSSTVDRFEGGIAIEVSGGWRAFFAAVHRVLTALTQSGTTAARPLNLLWTGRTYFDTDLGIPIWFNGSEWVDAQGNPA